MFRFCGLFSNPEQLQMWQTRTISDVWLY
jgi:hypothetical protein